MKRFAFLSVLFLTVVILFTVVPAAQAIVAPVPPPTTDKAPDDRINWKHGDAYAVLSPRKDAQGNPVLHIYCVDAEGNGSLDYILTQEVFDKAPAGPAADTMVGETDVCRVPIKFYVLTTGEYQVNIGPDVEGKIDVIIFTGLPPKKVHYNHLEWQPPQS